MSKCRTVISLVEKQEAQANNEKLVTLISGVRNDIASLGNALSRQLADIRDRQGEVAQVIQRQTDQMELASEQARSRSEAALNAQQTFIKNRDDARDCKARGGWLCGTY
ncbi:hypothetical protein WDW89_12925 [Deltaproteobacteria bacterium TL4]